MEFFDVIKNRHSIRTFSDQPVEPEKLQQILETEVSNLKDVDSTEEINQKSTEFEFNRLKPLERAEAYALVAEALYSIGDLPNSLTAYKNALDSSLVQQPGWSSRLSFGLGSTAMALGQPETAIAAFIEAGKADPNNYMINSSISEAYARIQLTGDAFQAAIRAVRQDSNNPETLIWFVNQCLFLYEHPTGKSLPIYEYAQQAIDRAIAITPDRANLYILSARVQILHGEQEKAVIILSRLKDPQAGDVNLNIQCLQQAAVSSPCCRNQCSIGLGQPGDDRTPNTGGPSRYGPSRFGPVGSARRRRSRTTTGRRGRSRARRAWRKVRRRATRWRWRGRCRRTRRRRST